MDQPGALDTPVEDSLKLLASSAAPVVESFDCERVYQMLSELGEARIGIDKATLPDRVQAPPAHAGPSSGRGRQVVAFVPCPCRTRSPCPSIVSWRGLPSRGRTKRAVARSAASSSRARTGASPEHERPADSSDRDARCDRQRRARARRRRRSTTSLSSNSKRTRRAWQSSSPRSVSSWRSSSKPSRRGPRRRPRDTRRLAKTSARSTGSSPCRRPSLKPGVLRGWSRKRRAAAANPGGSNACAPNC